MDQRRRRARRLPPEERRAQLLACALQVFARRGLGEGRHAEIAAAAAVAVPTVFFYFPTREELVTAVLAEVGRFIIEEVVAPLQTRPEPAPKVLTATALAFAEFIETHPDHARIWLDWSTAIRDKVWPQYLDFQERVIAMLATTIVRGQHEGYFSADLDVDDAARLLVGSAHMIAQMKFTRREPAKVEHFVKSLIDGFAAPHG